MRPQVAILFLALVGILLVAPSVRGQSPEPKAAAKPAPEPKAAAKPAPEPKAAAKPAPLFVLLPLDGDNFIPTLSSELQKVVVSLGRRVQLSSLRLDELMLAVGCKRTTVACLQSIGEMIKTGGIILGTARRRGEGVEMSLRWFDVQSGSDLGQAVRLVSPEPRARRKILIAAARDLLGIKGPAVTPQESVGSLSVSATVPFVEVILDGQPRGSVPLELRQLAVGHYTVVARREGYLPWQGRAEVKPNQMTRVEIEMVVSPLRSSAPNYLEAIRMRTWIVAGGGGLCLALGGIFGAHMKAQQHGMNDTQGVTLDEIRQMQDYQSTGERDAVVANVFFGIGSAAVVTAVVLSYLDYRRSRATVAAEMLTVKGPPIRVGLQSVQLDIRF